MRQRPEPVGGEHVLEWIASDEGRGFASRWARRRGLHAGDITDGGIDDLVADAQVAVLVAMRSGDLRVHNPAAYGTQVIKSVVRATLQGRTRDRAVLTAVRAEHDPDTGAADDLRFDDTLLDELRMVIDVMAEPSRPWLTGAALAYLTLSESVEALSEGVPQPKAGATPLQARGWAALWFAGVRDVFPGPLGDPSAQRRRRGRYVDHVLEHLRVAVGRFRIHQREVSDA